MVSTLAGAITNVILYPLFILPLHRGMMGTTVATVAGQMLTAAQAIGYLVRIKLMRPGRRDFGLGWKLDAHMLSLGITSFISPISMATSMVAVNNKLRKYSALDTVFSLEHYGQIPMAVQSIVMKFFQIVVSVAEGLAARCIPIVGYKMGAAKNGRVRGIFTCLFVAEAAVGAVALILAEVLPLQLTSLFSASNESVYYTEFVLRAFRVYLCMVILACVNKSSCRSWGAPQPPPFSA